MPFDDFKGHTLRTDWRGILDGLQSRNRLVWTVSAILSLLTSRYLLVELNVHYPLHLHLIHLATAGIIAAISYFRSRQEPSTYTNEQLTASGWARLGLLAASMAISMILIVQAVLHFQNFPSLVILTTIAYCTEAWIFMYSGHYTRSKQDIARVVIVTFACAGILLGEYRLLVPGLETAIPALLLAGIARALRYLSVDDMPGQLRDPRRMNVLFCGTGLAITLACTLFRTNETWSKFFSALELEHLPLLAVNTMATVIAMLMGQSILYPMDNVRTEAEDVRYHGSIDDMLTLLTMTGIAGLSSTLMLRRSYASWIQLGFFFLGAAYVGGRPVITSLRAPPGEYKVLASNASWHSRDSESFVSLDDSDSIHVDDTRWRRWKSFLRILLIAILLPSVWISYCNLNFTERIFPQVVEESPILDLGYTPEVGVEFVISMYKERVDEVAYLISRLKSIPNLRESQVHIYVKDDEANVEWVQQGTGADIVTILPNIGREGETYLNHIINNWNNLAKHTVFLQADVHNPREFYPRIGDYFDPERTGMLNLGWSGQVCNCEDCGDRFGFKDTTHIFPEIHDRINGSAVCDQVLLSYKGQFIVSAQRIRGVDISVYHDLHDALVDENSWAHQEEYLQGRPDTMSAPVFGYTMERLWNLLFQCNSMAVAWKCASMVSGSRVGGSIEDCQCFDPVS